MKLQLDNLAHTYTSPAGEPHPVIQIPEWTLQPGQQVMLRGVSGSGKTTLFNIIAGLMRPTAGTVYYGEQSLYALSEQQRDRFRAQHIGYIFQSHYLISSLTAADNVVMPMVFANRVPGGERRKHAEALLGQLGLAEYAAYRPAQLSTGQRLRVGIARALANKPAVVLADEPTAALDPAAGERAMDFIQETCAASSAVLVVSSHDPALAGRFSEIVTLQNGQLGYETAGVSL